MRRHVPTTADVIRARAAYAGLSPDQLRRRVGISASTWSRRMNSGGWALAEIAAIDRLVHFEGDDIEVLLGRKK